VPIGGKCKRYRVAVQRTIKEKGREEGEVESALISRFNSILKGELTCYSYCKGDPSLLVNLRRTVEM